MDGFTDDLWAIILAKLPLKIINSSKLVCKQWKSILESPYFRELFSSLHQNSHCSWSLMYLNYSKEVLAHYGCNTWGLERSLGSYISSFFTNKFKTERSNYRVCTYTDVGLILFSEVSIKRMNQSLYVANPVSKECVEVPSPKEHYHPLGIATRSENGVLLSYKVVLFVLFDYYGCRNTNFNLLIYSSETGLWSGYKFHSPFSTRNVISLHENLHWFALNSHNEEVVASINFYATGMGSVQCRLTPLPDSGKQRRLKRKCTTCQGFLMYMNIISAPKADGSLEDKLCVWRLKSEEWQLVYEITCPFTDLGFEYSPLGINPFDVKTVYFWSNKHQVFISINLHNGKCVHHNELESSKDTQYFIGSHLASCVLPQWLHRIPVRRVS